MKEVQPLARRVLIIPALSAAAALALIALALLPGPDASPRLPQPAVPGDIAAGGGNPARLDPAAPMPAPRP